MKRLKTGTTGYGNKRMNVSPLENETTAEKHAKRLEDETNAVLEEFDPESLWKDWKNAVRRATEETMKEDVSNCAIE